MRTFSAVILAGGRSSRMGMPKAALPFGDSTILGRLIDTLSADFQEIVVVAAPASDEPFSIDRMLAQRIDSNVDSPESARPGTADNLKYRTRLVIERDETAFEGPVGALKRGLARTHSEIVFACSCDLPLLRREMAFTMCAILDGQTVATPTIVNAVATGSHEATAAAADHNVGTPTRRHDAAMPTVEGFPQPLCAAYRREPTGAALLAMEAIGERRLSAVSGRLSVKVIDEVMLRAIDTDLRSFLNVNTAEDYARALRLARSA